MKDEKVKKIPPSMDEWIKEAKEDSKALSSGMYLIHNGVVRETPKAKVRRGIDDGSTVTAIDFSYDSKKVDKAIEDVYKMKGVSYIKVWLNEGRLDLGDDIMYAFVGGDIRPNVINALESLLGKIKSECVSEIEYKD